MPQREMLYQQNLYDTTRLSILCEWWNWNVLFGSYGDSRYFGLAS